MEMDKFNQFFRKLYSTPSLLWKAGASLLFISLAVIIFFTPNLIYGLSTSSRNLFSIIMLCYGLFRLAGFYTEYKSLRDE